MDYAPTPMLVPSPGGNCGWTKWDKYGEAYPCDKPSHGRIVYAPEVWDGEYCKYHAPRALKRAMANALDDSD